MTAGIQNLYLYQARDGAIYIAHGRNRTRLTHAQLWQLGIDLPNLHDLNDFSEDEYLAAYKAEKDVPHDKS